ncbi:MAG: hypothetical protein WC473_00690 [Patescibacteria group bacterium]
MRNLTRKSIDFAKLDTSEIPLNPKLDSFVDAGFGTMSENELGSDSVVRLLSSWDDRFELADLRDNLNEAQEIFQRLRDHYHVKIAPFIFAIGNDSEGKLAAYAVVNKVNGINLDLLKKDDISPNEAEVLRQDLIETWSGLVDYYFDCLVSDQELFWDVFPTKQYVYGCIGQEKEKHPYMIDIEIRINNQDHLSRAALSSLVYDVKGIEEDLGIDLSPVKEKLKLKISEFLKQPNLVADASLKNNMRDYLNEL